MPLHTFAGFVAEVPGDPGEDGGEALARSLVEAVRGAGFRASQPFALDYAWAFDTDGPGGRVRSLLGFIGDLDATPPRQWLLTNALEAPGCLPSLFDARTARDRREGLLEQVCVALHAGMSADERITDLWWHDPATFDSPGDRPRPTPAL